MERLQRWSLIAEIVAAIAVVGSIGYLTVEVQRNTRAVQSQTSQGTPSSKRIWREIELFFGSEFRTHVNGFSESDCARTSYLSPDGV
jgi:hypothetical protein